LYYLPESPKFLLTQGKRKEALTVLRQMYVVNTRKEEDSYGVDELVWEELSDDDPFKKDYGMWKTMWKQTVPLFKGELLTKTLMMCFLQFGIFASNAGIVMWYPEILNRMSHYVIDHPQNDVGLCNAILEEDDLDSFNSTEVSYKVCKDQVKTQVFLVSVIMGVAYAFIYLFIGCVINTFGKKKLMIAFVVVTTITGLCSQFVYGYGLIQILIGIFLMGGAGIGITNAIAVDLFPTQVRGMALAVSLMFGRIGAMTGTNIVGPLIYNVCDYLFYFVAADHLALIIVLLLLPSKPRLPKLVT
jgi:VNT family MFS transporter (synaptic vesicle glycoprotein 2)